MSSSISTQKVISAFKPLRGGFSEAIAPGGRLITLNGGAGATWWERDTPITAELPPSTPAEGSRWSADGKSLWIGLGRIDLSQRMWRAEPALQSWNQAGPRGETPIKAISWFADAAHLAMLLEARDGTGTKPSEIVVVSADGKERGRRTIAGATSIVAAQDRLLVMGASVVLLDLDAQLVKEPSPMPDAVIRGREGAGMFAAVGAAGAVALIRSSDGAVLATWQANAIDAVPVTNGIITVNFEGEIRVGCIDKGAIRQVAAMASGVKSGVIQLVDDRIIIAGAGAVPVHEAAFTNLCR